MSFFIDNCHSSKLAGLWLGAAFGVQKEVCLEEEVHVTFQLMDFCLKSGLCHSFTLFKGQLQEIKGFPSILVLYEKQYELLWSMQRCVTADLASEGEFMSSTQPAAWSLWLLQPVLRWDFDFLHLPSKDISAPVLLKNPNLPVVFYPNIFTSWISYLDHNSIL